MNPLFPVIGLILLFCIILFAFWKYKSFTAQKKKDLTKLSMHMKKISSLSHTQQILEYDKVLDQCLYILGYKGSMGNKMKAYGKHFIHQNNIWYAHKLRNRIAHEVGFQPSSNEYAKAKKYFTQEISAICKKYGV